MMAKSEYIERKITLRRLGYATYKEYLKSFIWSCIKDTAKEYFGEYCYCCGALWTELHHSKYDYRTMMGLSFENLYPLCHRCHKNIELREPRGLQQAMIRLLKKARENSGFEILDGRRNRALATINEQINRYGY